MYGPLKINASNLRSDGTVTKSLLDGITSTLQFFEENATRKIQSGLSKRNFWSERNFSGYSAIDVRGNWKSCSLKQKKIEEESKAIETGKMLLIDQVTAVIFVKL